MMSASLVTGVEAAKGAGFRPQVAADNGDGGGGGGVAPAMPPVPAKDIVDGYAAVTVVGESGSFFFCLFVCSFVPSTAGRLRMCADERQKRRVWFTQAHTYSHTHTHTLSLTLCVWLTAFDNTPRQLVGYGWRQLEGARLYRVVLEDTHVRSKLLLEGGRDRVLTAVVVLWELVVDLRVSSTTPLYARPNPCPPAIVFTSKPCLRTCACVCACVCLCDACSLLL